MLCDTRFPPLGHLLRQLELDTLSRLYVAGCRLRLDAECQLMLARVSLRSLVLSHTALQHLPDCLFDMPALEVLHDTTHTHTHTHTHIRLTALLPRLPGVSRYQSKINMASTST